MTFDCMTPEEYALWSQTVGALNKQAKTPCVDCPLEFHLQEKAAGRCDREPFRTGRPVEDFSDRKRAMWREAGRRYRARKSVQLRVSSRYNDGAGTSSSPANLLTTPFSLLVPGGTASLRSSRTRR